MSERSQKPDLISCSFYFEQDGNCIDGGDESLTIEVKGDDTKLRSDTMFFVIKTEQWSFDSVDEIKAIVDTISKTIKEFNK